MPSRHPLTPNALKFFTISLSHTHSLSHSLSLSHTHTLSLVFSLSLSLSLSHTHSLSHSLTHTGADAEGCEPRGASARSAVFQGPVPRCVGAGTTYFKLSVDLL